VGLLSFLWFLIRVIPKPSRAAYPCQRVAAPVAAGFVTWLLGLGGCAIALRRARARLRESRYALALVCAAIGLIAGGWAFWAMPPQPAVSAPFVPTDSPNTPQGTARGIHPGRVVWVHDADATSWDGSTGYYWDDSNTSQAVAAEMMSKSIRWLAGEATDSAAWDAVFRNFNQTHNGSPEAYQSGEKVAVKVNLNNSASYGWSGSTGANPAPQTVYALLDQLVNVAGVAEADIAVYDASRLVGDPIYDKCYAAFPGVRFIDNDGQNGREKVARDTNAVIHFSGAAGGEPVSGTCNVPTCVSEAKYLINLAHFRAHNFASVTATAKNHFGSIWFSDMTTDDGWKPNRDIHEYVCCVNSSWQGGFTPRAMNTYNALVDLMGCEQLGGKTLLYIIDGLYGAGSQSAKPHRFEMAPFDNDWTSSLFVSQDGVAIDSVALDFLRNEPSISAVVNAADNYLHEAALADNPPSGTIYDPEGDGSALASLGAHEHWNNAADKQYTRNLGTGDGIELVSSEPPNTPPGISITGPADGATFVEGATVAITVDAADSDGSVANVTFFADADLLGSDAIAPYEYSWSHAPVGEHELTAVAEDDQGTTTVSDTVTIRILEITRARGTWLKYAR
jgi:uncharacterized protein (DUF362 family)